MNALAFDLGSGSVRGILGVLKGGKIESVREIYRFENSYFPLNGKICWDYLALYRGIIHCLSLCKQKNIEIDSIGIDSWAQDYALIGQAGEVLGTPKTYRDYSNEKNEYKFENDNQLDINLFRQACGVGYFGSSTLRQLWAEKTCNPARINYAKSFLFIPYLMVYLLTGVLAYDASLVAIAELGDAMTDDFRKETLCLLGLANKIPKRFFRGQVIGRTNDSVFKATGYDHVPVVCTEAHDTTSAVSAIPNSGEFLWISSGSFNMLGAVIINSQASIDLKLLDAGFSNTMMSKRRRLIMAGCNGGMYYMQQCMKAWRNKGINITYKELTDYALNNKSNRFFRFEKLPDIAPDMDKEISKALSDEGFYNVSNPFEIYEAFSNSLAMACSAKLSFFCKETGFDPSSVYIISGGSNASDINKRTAELLGKKVYAGLPEASAMGNLMAQWGSDFDFKKNMGYFETRRF